TSPVCAHARVQGDALSVRALYWDPETGATATGTDRGAAAEAEQIGIRLANRLRGEVRA
ncbi:MAG: hydroxymethylbilane synthase, partial [Clostridia bacterium]|nr:hydroxymethylbilane synthase [Clostridia bacterium]